MAKPYSEFLEMFTEDRIPEIKCPLCGHGYLRNNKSDLKIEESAESSNGHQDEYWEPEFTYGGFIGKLVCDNSKCRNGIFYSGESTVEHFHHNNGGETLEWVLLPRYFSEQIQIIQLKEVYPKKVKQLLNSSFELFWIDSDSCGNKIRIIVETILDLQKIPRYPKTGKRKPIILHDRINKYKIINGELGKLMEAIKWIGNHGSHTTGLEREDLLQAYGMLKIVLDKLYDTSDEEYHKIAIIINKKKKPTSVTLKNRFK